MSAPAHPEETLQDYVDGRLSGPAAADVRLHLEGCETCRAVRDELMTAREALATLRVDAPMPADLLASVLRSLDAEAASATAAAPSPPAPSARGTVRSPEPARWAASKAVWATVAAAAVLVAYLALGSRIVPMDVPAQAARDLGAVGSRSLPLDVQTSEAAVLERYFAEAPQGPRVRVIDLGMMGIPLEGGVRHALGGVPSALYAYRTPTGARLVCQMYVGRLSDLPPPDDVRDNRGFRFQIYTRGAVTVVFWQEGDLVCVLASELPAGEVIALAFQKAMAPA